MEPEDLKRRRYGRLVVTALSHYESKSRRNFWHCLCDCGNMSVVMGKYLKSGETTSCGCYKRNRLGDIRRTHGKTRTRIYKIWIGMKMRCFSEAHPDYKNYGGRGITICDRWSDFTNFYADMGDPPPRLTIERKNNDGNYEPSNCKWATRAEQAKNKRNTGANK